MYKKFTQKYGRDGDSRQTEMYDAVCAECGDDCKVPFKPTGNRPVLCRECFQEEQEDSGYDRAPREKKPSFQGVCDTCGNECSVPFKPIKGRPLFCGKCIGKGDAGMGSKASDFTPSQYETLNRKLDKILKLLDFVAEEAGDLEEESFEEKPFHDKKLTRGQRKRAKRTGRAY